MIKKLSSNLINQIAAGEVVDNPVSVVKELIENSIDAKSTSINIYLEDGGMSKIIIEDNGIGIKKNNIVKAFERFATSKISKIDDLNNINTLGFRGEALPSISSVSNIIISTKHQDEKIGYKMKITDNKYSKITPSEINSGTTIEVKNLFFNIPVRKKFLKSEKYEYRKILRLFKEFALCHFDKDLSLYNNEKMIYSFKSEDLLYRIESLFGNDFSKSCLKVNFDKDDYHINGYIGNLSIVKGSTGFQFLFVNGRCIKNQLINLSISSAYRSLISRGEFPSFILFLTLPSKNIDVNVHPKKLEIKFKNELQVQHIFKKSTGDTLRDILNVIPTFNKINIAENFVENSNITFPDESSVETNIPSISNDKYSSSIKKAEIRLTNYPDNKLSVESNNIWQIHNKYILTEIKSGLIVIDQHVAHERVLYENALDAIEGDGLPSQAIIFPKTIKFDPEHYSYILDLSYYLKKIGFEFREFGDHSIIIEGVPSDLELGKEEEVINDIIDKYTKTKKKSSSFVDYIAATYACKAAVKAGEKLSNNECKSLVDELFATKHPYYCPHGRPIIINLSLEDLDSRFERH
tara:strand:- start:8091 stop:9824 length:1734 start_codon:yes stop_codon:yes gene_type:complete